MQKLTNFNAWYKINPLPQGSRKGVVSPETAKTVTGGQTPPIQEGASAPSVLRGGDDMQITYNELFQFCLVLIGIINLIFQAKKK